MFLKKYKFLFIALIAIGSFSYFLFTPKPTAYLAIVGPVKMADGIGRQSVDFMNALYDEVSMCYYNTRRKMDFTDVPARIRPLLRNRSLRKSSEKILVYQESFPVIGKKWPACCLKKLGPTVPHQIRIAYSMCESSRIPPYCAEIFNYHFDAIAVPDAFLVEAYQLSGVTIPIFVLPLGIDISSFLEQPLKQERHTPFCFINNASCIPRKNHEGLVLAFHKAFGNNPDVRLQLDCRYCHSNALEKTSQLIEQLGCTNITLAKKKLTNAQYLDSFLQGDAFVTLSKGEGFSIQPREAMALGMPVIISDNTAHKTILKSNLACGISCPTEVIAYNGMINSYVGHEYLADIDEAADALRTLYENYETALLDAEKRRLWAEQYQFKNLKQLYVNLIKPASLTLGDKNEINEEGLITSSQEFFDKYNRLIKEQNEHET